jgi:hypothetical protein
MSLESVINDILQNLRPKCAVSNFASIAKILSQPRVASALSGKEPFKNEDALAHLAVARRMKSLSDLTAPLPIDWSQVDDIRIVLAGLADKTLHISINQEVPVALPEQQFYVYLTDERSYFISRKSNLISGKPEISTGYQSNYAPRMTGTCARRLVEALTKVGFRAQTVVSKVTGDVHEDFDAVWGTTEVKAQE